MLMRHPVHVGKQRHNILGNAFRHMVAHSLGKLCSGQRVYREEVDATTIFQRVELVGRTAKPQIDIVELQPSSPGTPEALISCKWMFRHERLNDLTVEARAYRSAAVQNQMPEAPFYVVTTEFDPARLVKLLNDRHIDGVFHVHRTLVVDVLGLDGRVTGLRDITDLVRSPSSRF